jgi:hypothetical protein
LPVIQNAIRGAQQDLAAVDAAALRPPQEAVVEAGIHLQALDSQAARVATSKVKRAYQLLEGLDQAALSAPVAAVETARSALADLDGAIAGAGGQPSTCTVAYLILAWVASRAPQNLAPLFQPGNAYQSVPAPDRVYAACYPERMPIPGLRTALGLTLIRWREITMRQYNDYVMRFGHVGGMDANLLQQGADVEAGNA